MKRLLQQTNWRFIICYAVLFAVLGLIIVGAVGATDSSTAPSPAWAAPNVSTIKEVGSAPSVQDSAVADDNLDCQLITYRLSNDSTMRDGCFTATAYGLLDNDNDIVIFNGSSEGIKLDGISPHQVLVAWPHAGDTVSLVASPLDGAYVSLYSGVTNGTANERDYLGRLVGRQLLTAPDIALKDGAGKTLLINAASLAFSDNGSWMVAETLGGAFVRINLATLDQTAFAPAFGTGGTPGLKASAVSISNDGQYVAIENRFADSFKVYDLAQCKALALDATYRQCGDHEYWPLAAGQLTNPEHIYHVRFINDGLLSFRSDAKQYEMAPTNTISSLIDYLGVGDSYTSGEGAFKYLSGTDTTDNKCHLSTDSYPLLLVHDLYTNAGGHSVACSGAVIQDVEDTAGNYTGQTEGTLTSAQLRSTQPDFYNSILSNYLPGYVAQQQFVQQYQPAIMTVSVGGDDVGFGDIIHRCVEPHISDHLSSESCYSTYEDRVEIEQLIDRTSTRLSALYRQLQAEDPSGRMYVIGYPQIVSDTGNCALNVHLSKSELEFSIELINYLNAAVQNAASAAGEDYVDISQALAGHRLCETASYDVAVNGLTAGKDAGALGLTFLGKESYHPTALGQELIEQAILHQTHNLKQRAPVSSLPTGDGSLSNAPKSGRKINNVIPDPRIISQTLVAGKSTSIHISGLRDGLLPNITYSVHLDGADGPVIGQQQSGDDGTIDGLFTIPISTDNGGHSIDVVGAGNSDQPIDVTQPISVTNNIIDSDGDGIPNSGDSCPLIVNSGQDADHDGIDDACDNFIGQPPATVTATPTEKITVQVSAITAAPLSLTPAAAVIFGAPAISVSAVPLSQPQSSQNVISTLGATPARIGAISNVSIIKPALSLAARHITRPFVRLRQPKLAPWWALWCFELLIILALILWLAGLNQEKLQAKRKKDCRHRAKFQPVNRK